MIYAPRIHQAKAADFLSERTHAGLFLGLGMGKTVVTLTHLSALLADKMISKALIIAPKRVAESTWTTEAAKWDHLQHLGVSLVAGTPQQRAAALAAQADIYIISRDLVSWLIQYVTAPPLVWDFDCVVIDELSSFKNPQAKRFRALKRVIQMCSHVYGLTGSPASNGYMDLWPEIYLLDHGERLGRTLTAYRQTYFHPGAHKGHIVYQWLLNPGAQREIDKRLRNLCLSMDSKDWLSDFPMTSYIPVSVHMRAEERKTYDRFELNHVLPLLKGQLIDSAEDAESAVLGSTAAVMAGKLLQMSGGAVYDDAGEVLAIHDAKLEALDELIEAAAGQTVLVFYGYRHERDRLLRRYGDARELLTGADIDDWNAGKIHIAIAHPASCGHGLNLQFGGHIAVWVSLPWSLELYQQANGRLARMGQKDPVFIYHILCADTIDDRVMSALQAKDTTQRGLLEALTHYINKEEDT